jgi:hypothetical protein
MKRLGNTASNRLFNPRNAKPAIPIDIDEVDGVMERFIRQKYEQKLLSTNPPSASTHHSGSTSSDDRTAPQLPPKPAKRFAFKLRSTPSTLPVPQSPRSPASPMSGTFGFGRRASPEKRSNKPAKIFGVDIGSSRTDNYELKLIQLREMGFPDDRRNMAILKGENGNIDRAVATLIRLGEGSRASSGRSSPVPDTPPKDDDYIPAAENNQIGGVRIDLQDKALPPPPPVEDSFHHQSNPFMQSQPTLEQSLQHLQVSQPSQLFPNATGGPVQQHHQPYANNPFLQTYTPPPQISHQTPYTNLASFTPQPNQQLAVNTNPFLRTTPSPSPPPPNNPFMHSLNTPPGAQFNQAWGQDMSNQPAAYNPFYAQQSVQTPPPPPPGPGNPFHAATFPQFQSQLQQQFQPQSQHQFQPQQQQQWNQASGAFMQDTYAQSPMSAPAANNPFASATPQYQQQTQAPRYDKASILALYSLAPATAQSQAAFTASVNSSPLAQPALPTQPSTIDPFVKRSFTAPVSAPSSNNPFGIPSPPEDVPTALPSSQRFQTMKTGQGVFGPRPGHESIDFSTASALLNGRHSPDMFAGLSARVMR